MIYPVILSGGSGTRLWPMSRATLPKQLLSMTSERSMFQETVLRLQGIEGLGQPFVVCNNEHRFIVAEQLREIDVAPLEIVLEPFGRNTAPAAAVAALSLLERDAAATMLLLPADHLIRNVGAFHQAVRLGIAAVEQGHLVTFGIVPTAPETGYGYIQQGEALAGLAACRVARFVEKPGKSEAEALLASGEYYWNSGMFLFSCRQFLNELEKYEPEMLAACRRALANAREDLDFLRLDEKAFEGCPSNSIDYAVMEHTRSAALVKADIGWNDIGAWSALWEVGDRDGSGNVRQGDVWLDNVKDSLVRAESRMVAAIGVKNVVIVETADAVLVVNRDQAQDVKKVVEHLKQAGRCEHEFHTRVLRPWGWYEGIDQGERFQVKRISVNPGAALSLQMHHHRAEHWVVVRGTAKVTRGDETFLVGENESTYIPLGVKHRLENPGKMPLHIVEVQSGSYLGEDDIVRFDDHYGRKS